MIKSKKHIFWQLLLLIVCAVFIIKKHYDTPYQHNTGVIFGTIYNITYQHDRDLGTDIVAQLAEVDSSLSMFNPNSTISRINRNELSTPDKMFARVFDLAMQVSDKTGGAFDITVAPLVNAWGFGFKKGRMPTPDDVDSLINIIGYKKICMSEKLGKRTIVKTSPSIMLDCSAIAKGYGCDVVADYLKKQGVKNFMVEIGGEVVTSGVNSKKESWKIGVMTPTDDSLNTNKELQTILNVKDMAMATSGNYRNFYYKNGKKYAHTIDPHTGYPVEHNLLSATVLAKQCATADAFATAFMVTGMEKAKKILNENPELMAYFIYSDHTGKTKIWYSPSMKGIIAK